MYTYFSYLVCLHLVYVVFYFCCISFGIYVYINPTFLSNLSITGQAGPCLHKNVKFECNYAYTAHIKGWRINSDGLCVCVAGSRKGSEVPYLPSHPSPAADEVHVRPTDRPKHQD